MPNPKKTAIKVQKVRLYPDAEMKQVLDELCDYRRYCWHWRKNINGVGCTLKLQEPVNVITPELGYGNTGEDGSK